MSTFWKPLAESDQRLQPGMQVKQLGNRTFALWARCEACQWSGPFHAFCLWERGTEVGFLCGPCNQRQDISGMLKADGWTWVG